MNEMADIENGLNFRSTVSKNTSLKNLFFAIKDYNSKIDGEIDSFTKHFNQLEECLTQLLAVSMPNHKKTDEFLKLQRQLNLLKILLEKYRIGIHNLQLTNNILLNFSDEFNKEVESFRCNLIQVSALLLDAEESMVQLLDEFEQAD